MKHSPLKASKRQCPSLFSDAITGAPLSQTAISHLDIPLQDVSTVVERPALFSNAITGAPLSQTEISHLDIPLKDVSTVVDDCFGPSPDLATRIPCTPALPAALLPNTQSTDSDALNPSSSEEACTASKENT